MSVTVLLGGLHGPGPATAGVVAQPGTTAPNPVNGLAFAAILSTQVANGTDAPDTPVPQIPPETEVPGQPSLAEAVTAAHEPASPLARRTGTAVPDVGQGAGGAAGPREGDTPQGDGTLKPADALRIDNTRPGVTTRGDTASPHPLGDVQGPTTARPTIALPAGMPESGEESTETGARLPGAGPAILPGQAAGEIEASTPRVPPLSGGGGVQADGVPVTSDTPARQRFSLAAAAPDALSSATDPAPVSGVQATPSVVAQSGATPVAPAPTALFAPAPVASSMGAATPPAAAPPAFGPRAAPASAAVTFVRAPRVAPTQAGVLQAGISTAFVAVTGTASDRRGLVDTGLGPIEARVPTPMAGTPALPATTGHDIPRQIAIQIAHAAERGSGGTRRTIELSLSPEELGRVRLRLHPSEAGLNVTITADRPETLDLMRRNIDLLAREFLEIGYHDAQFDFAQGGQGTEPDHAAAPSAPAPALTAVPPGSESSAPAALLMLGDRLDIRL